MSRRRPPRQQLVTGFYGQPEQRRDMSLPWRACDLCRTKCHPYRYALKLICSACRWRAVYGRNAPT